MLRSIQQITQQLIYDIPGHIFKMKYISDENKLLIYENQKVYARILPLVSSLSLCIDEGYAPDRIIAMKHAFSIDFEKALIKELDIKYLVTKESGAEGGIVEKGEAAIQSGIEVIVIKRPQRSGAEIFFDMDKLIIRTGEILNG